MRTWSVIVHHSSKNALPNGCARVSPKWVSFDQLACWVGVHPTSAWRPVGRPWNASPCLTMQQRWLFAEWIAKAPNKKLSARHFQSTLTRKTLMPKHRSSDREYCQSFVASSHLLIYCYDTWSFNFRYKVINSHLKSAVWGISKSHLKKQQTKWVCALQPPENSTNWNRSLRPTSSYLRWVIGSPGGATASTTRVFSWEVFV